MQNTSEQYDAVVNECRSLFIKKMSDYGSAWRILRLPSLTDQIFIKAQRIRGLQQNDVRKVDEGEVSEFIGIINYQEWSDIFMKINIINYRFMCMLILINGHSIYSMIYQKRFEKLSQCRTVICSFMEFLK